MCASFAASWIIEFWLFDLRVLAQPDVWFQADTDTFLARRFAENTLLRHPNLSLFVGMPVAAAVKALAVLRVGIVDPIQVQNWLMLLVAPVASAVRTLAAFSSLRHLTGSRPLAIMLCLLDITAFATVVWGSVPETFPLSAASLAALYWLMVIDTRSGRLRWWHWTGVGIFATSVTLTNLAPFSILLGVTLLAARMRPLRAAALATATSVCVFMVTAILAAGGAALHGQLSDLLLPGSGAAFRSTPTAAASSELALAMAHTFVAPAAVPAPGREPPVSNPDYDFQFLLPTTLPGRASGLWREAFTVVVLAIGVAGYLYHRAAAIWLLPAAAILATNIVLHLFFGTTFFMYTLHWAFSMVWIIAGVAFLPGLFRTFAIAMLALFVVVTAVNSAFEVQGLLAYLRTV